MNKISRTLIITGLALAIPTIELWALSDYRRWIAAGCVLAAYFVGLHDAAGLLREKMGSGR